MEGALPPGDLDLEHMRLAGIAGASLRVRHELHRAVLTAGQGFRGHFGVHGGYDEQVHIAADRVVFGEIIEPVTVEIALRGEPALSGQIVVGNIVGDSDCRELLLPPGDGRGVAQRKRGGRHCIEFLAGEFGQQLDEGAQRGVAVVAAGLDEVVGVQRDHQCMGRGRLLAQHGVEQPKLCALRNAVTVLVERVGVPFPLPLALFGRARVFDHAHIDVFDAGFERAGL